MKGFAASVLVFAALSTVCAGRAFDEAQTAIKEIDQRYGETFRMGKLIIESADTEKKGVTTRGEAELLAHLDLRTAEIKSQFEKDAKTVLRLAITKAKPVSVIQCIRTVTEIGSKKIDNMYDTTWEKVVEIRLKKIEKLDFDVYAVTSILQGLKELIDEAKGKIQSGTGIITAVKKEALANCQSADLLLGEIEVNLHEPILSREYIKQRQELDRNSTKLKLELNTQLEKCLEKN